MPKLKSIIARTPESLAIALGLPAAAAREWQVQHALLTHLRDVVSREQLTHAAIAKKAGSSRTRITAILNGNLKHVSTDLLIRILDSLGYRVRVSVTKRPAKAA
jgi:predicted XRE-type DNA-binding protein